MTDKTKWPPCIVTAFDLPGTKDRAKSGVASSQMLEMRRFAVAQIDGGLPMHSHGYIWNDSILLLSYKTNRTNRQSVIFELSKFKQALDQQLNTQMYAISVRGLAFPQDTFSSPVWNGNVGDGPRSVVLKTSSWAMANCFHIEKTLGKTHKAEWYIDNRIAKGLQLPTPFAIEWIELLPKNEFRKICMYRGYLHEKG